MTDLGGLLDGTEPVDGHRTQLVTDWLAAQDFPADTGVLLALLVQRRAPTRVVDLVHDLPWSMTFRTLDDLLAYATQP